MKRPNKLPERIQKAVNRYLPVSVEGITFYPVLMDEYDEYAQTLPILEFMPQALPPDMARLPILEAFARIEIMSRALQEMEQTEKKGEAFRPLALCIQILILALRLGQGEKMKQRMERCRAYFSQEKLEKLVFMGNGGKAIEITPQLFQRLWPILAAQNGAEFADENANPEIVLAERQIALNKMPAVIPDPVNRIAWVAYKCGCTEEEIYKWPIAKFNRRAEIIITDMNYLACQIGEKSGLVDYSKAGGTPFPSPYLRRDAEALKSIEIGSIGGGAAARAVADGLRDTKNSKNKE